MDGTLNACAESGTVKHVILTSSIVAIETAMSGEYTESDWADDATDPYPMSKVCAERAAWDFVEKLDADKKFELVAMNPGLVTGPILTAANSNTTSVYLSPCSIILCPA